jgi:CheY-like chemotaxis protein
MKRFLRSFLKKPTPTSTLTAASQIYPSLNILSLFAEQVDRRQILHTVSQHLKKTEEAVVEELAGKLNLTYEATPPQVKAFRNKSAPSLATFAQLGALPIVEKSSVTGVICIEPLWLKGTIPEEFQRHLRLASWTTIQAALAQSQEIYIADDLPMEDAVLDIIATRVSEYGGKSFSLSTSHNELFYKFTTPEGSPAQGKVHQSIKAKLLARVSALASYYRGIIIINGTKYQVMFNEQGEPTFDRKFHIQLADEVQSSHTKLVPVKFLREQGVPNAQTLPLSLSQLERQNQINRNYIVVIEDSPLFAKTLSRFLGDQGISVKYFPLATAALHFLEHAPIPPSLIVCDLYLPEMSGKGFLDILRTRSSLLSLPVIILTSDDRIETELDLLRSGAVALLSKQEDPRKLIAHIERVLRSERLPASLPHAANSR